MVSKSVSDALLAELLGDILKVHDLIKALPVELDSVTSRLVDAGKGDSPSKQGGSSLPAHMEDALAFKRILEQATRECVETYKTVLNEENRLVEEQNNASKRLIRNQLIISTLSCVIAFSSMLITIFVFAR